MKNTLKISFAVLLVLTIPSGFVHASLESYGQAYVKAQQVQSITNGLNNINNSINAQTKALKDAQWKQKMAALNQECVAYYTEYIRTNETGLKEIDKSIADYMEQPKGDTSDPAVKQQMRLHLNYLYTLRSRQVQYYQSILDTRCTNSALNASCVKSNGPNAEMKSYDATTGAIQCKCTSGYVWSSAGSACVVQQVQQTAPTQGLQCNGKSWSECPVGSNFFCPSSGDASCTPQQQSQVDTPPSTINTVVQETPKVTPPIVKDKPPTISTPPAKQKAPTVSNSVASTFKDVPQLTNAPIAPEQTKKKVIWSWFKGLFGF